MALSNFQQRAITGIVFVLVIIGALQNIYSIAALSILVGTFCVFELGRMFKVPAMVNYGYVLTAGVILFFLMFRQYQPVNEDDTDNIYKAISAIILVAIVSRNWMDNHQSLWLVLGTIYILVGCYCLFLVGSMSADSKEYPFYINRGIFVLVVTWSNDVFAYLIGRKIGKTKLASSISPNKTIEGTVAGLLFAGLAASIMHYFEQKEFSILVFIIGIAIGIAATIGDLIESKAKRTADVKDSGSILPGHGGFLDRFDAMLLTMPVFYLLSFLIR